MLKAEIDNSVFGTHILVLYGIHGSKDGFMLKHDEALVHTFNAGMSTVKNKQKKDEIKEKNMTLEGLVIWSELDKNGKRVLADLTTIIEKSRKCHKLILCFCYTTVNMANSFLRASGLYADLYMANELSEIHGKLITFDLVQKKFIQEYASKMPQNVLLAGHFGCGKTVVGTQFVSIKISEFELREGKNLFRVIIGADVVHADNKLLKDLREKHFDFVEKEINCRRQMNGQEEINIEYTTLNALMEKHNVVPGTAQDIEVMKTLISRYATK